MKRRSSNREGSLSPPPLKRKIESTTTKKSVTNFFTPLSKKVPEKIVWRIVGNSLLVGKYDPQSENNHGQSSPILRRKIAAFDFDSTLILTSSGNVFGKDAADWRWWDAKVPGVLRELYATGYLVVIFSNQGGISLKADTKTVKQDQKRLAEFKAKALSVFSQLHFPISIYAATSRDKYRKPRTGMWTEVIDDHDLDTANGPDLDASVFIGDASGRPARDGTKADHSSSDRDFASNVGIQFKTPEEFFLHEPAQQFYRAFEPMSYLPAARTTLPRQRSVHDDSASADKEDPVDLVLFCGSPGAGKSTFYWKKLKPLGYERVNQDTLKTREKCLKVASECLSTGKSVVVDNTNADPDTRKVWVQLAQKIGIPIRCMHFTASPKLCEHNDTVRALNDGTLNPEKRSILPHSAFSSYAARFRQPELKEGFHDITRIEFEFQGDDRERALWSRFWI
ncbi:hypothetical protein MMC20_005514 [Loxospora ochrophaea]|nr:hypothetical protein [Loxospora ochrophaea]